MKTLILIILMSSVLFSCGKGGGGATHTTSESKYTPGGDIKVQYDAVIKKMVTKQDMLEMEMVEIMMDLYSAEEIVLNEMDKSLEVFCSSGICKVTNK